MSIPANVGIINIILTPLQHEMLKGRFNETVRYMAVCSLAQQQHNKMKRNKVRIKARRDLMRLFC